MPQERITVRPAQVDLQGGGLGGVGGEGGRSAGQRQPLK